MSTTKHSYCVHILGNWSGTLYIGFTGYLHRRVLQHKFQPCDGFAKQYGLDRLLYWESYDDVHKAIGREKQLKGWRRSKKIALIESKNPQWLDLSGEWYPWCESKDSPRGPSTSHCDSLANRNAALRGCDFFDFP